MNTAIAARVSELVADRVPFVHATVVRAQVPASARPGDSAIVLGDGTIEGFVGGVCAEGSVRTAAMTALDDGAALLLRVLPEDDGAAFPDAPGARVVVNPCLSGGALEIFLEPMLPPPAVEVVGHTPIADAVLALGGVMGYEATRRGTSTTRPATALVVASHGRDETDAIRAALDAGVGWIALVASHRRGDAVLDQMGLTAEERARIHTPAGLDLGGRTAGEIAVAILAEIVQAVRRGGLTAPEGGATRSAPAQVVDPVCGMTVTVTPDTPHLVVDGVDLWFCGTGCRDHHAAALGGVPA